MQPDSTASTRLSNPGLMQRLRPPAQAPARAALAPGSGSAAGRLAWVDCARGIAIVLVVWGHCYRGLAEAGIIPPGGMLPWVDGVIYSFHNPLFFFLSGAFSRNPAQLSRREFWAGRVAVIAWPYVLWMSVALAVMTGLSGVTNSGRAGAGLSTFLYEPISPFWFLYCLVLANLFTYALGGLGQTAVLALAAVVYVAAEALGDGIVPSAGWALFYVCLGASCSGFVRQPGFIHAVSRPAVLVLLGAGTVACSVGMIRLGFSNQLMVPAALLGSAFVFGIALPLSAAAARVPPIRLLGVLGRISLTVLVVHVLGTAGARIVLVRLLHVDAVWLHIAAGMAAGLGVPLALQWTAAKAGVLRLAGLPRG